MIVVIFPQSCFFPVGCYVSMRTKAFFSSFISGFRIRIFLADPDPGKIFHADPDPGGIRGRGLGVKGKNDFFFIVFFTFQMILHIGCLKSELKK